MLDNQYRLNAPSCIGEAIEDDLIVINLGTGRYYNIRNEGVAIWQALTQGVTSSALIAANDWTDQQIHLFKEYVRFLVEEQLLVALPAMIEAPPTPCIELHHADKPFQVDVFTDMEEMLLLDPIHDASADAGWPQKA